MKGRKPKPTFLRLLDGNAGHRPLNAEEPVPTGEIGDPPEWFNAAQRRLWSETVRSAPDGLLKNVDASLLTTWVLARDMQRWAAEKIEQYGALVRNPATGAPMASPALKIQNEQAAILTRCNAELGFTPSSRSRVRVSKSGKGKSIFDDLKELD
jgi:P27 family predicted phage terminase small subunit